MALRVRAALVTATAVALLAMGSPVAGAPGSGDEEKPTMSPAALALFEEGRKLMDQKQYAAACGKLEKAHAMFAGAGVLFHLSDCYEKVGRTASAWTGFRDVAAASQAAGRTAREKAARDRAAALEPRLTKLLLRVADPAEGMVVQRNDIEHPKPLWGEAIPVDPGEYTITASAPGKQAWADTVRVEGEGATVPFEVPALIAGAPADPPPDVETKPGDTPGSAKPVTGPDEAERSWQMPLGVALFAVGVAGAGAGVALGLVAQSDADDADCGEDGTCSQAGLDQRDSAVALGNAGTGVFIAGAVLGVTGIVLWATAPTDEEQPAATGPGPAARLRVGPSGVFLSGRW